MDTAALNALNDDQKKTLIQARLNEGQSQNQIGIEFGKVGTTIGRWIKKWGITRQITQVPNDVTTMQHPAQDAALMHNEMIDVSFEKLIIYKKYSLQNGVDIGTNTILSLLDKTKQLENNEKEVFEHAEMLDLIEDQLRLFLENNYEPKDIEMILRD